MVSLPCGLAILRVLHSQNGAWPSPLSSQQEVAMLETVSLSSFDGTTHIPRVRTWSHDPTRLYWQFVVIQTPWTAAHQAPLSFTISQSLLKLVSIKLMMSSTHLILCCPLLLMPSIFPSFRVFSNESALHIKWPKYWSFNFNISPSNEYSVLISFRIAGFDPPCYPRESQQSSPASQFESINSSALS